MQGCQEHLRSLFWIQYYSELGQFEPPIWSFKHLNDHVLLYENPVVGLFAARIRMGRLGNRIVSLKLGKWTFVLRVANDPSSALRVQRPTQRRDLGESLFRAGNSH